MQTQSKPKQFSIFCVNDEPFCVWDANIQSLNFEFLDRIDPKYFQYVAVTNEPNLEGENKHRSATAIRTGFYHSLETFFSLVCASLQAPDCIFAWILKYKNAPLRSMVSAISSGSSNFPCKLNLEQINWESIAKAMLGKADMALDEKEQFITLYAKLWSRLAEVFVDEKSNAEYNSIKHGLRTGSGGFGLAIGIEEQYGVPAPPDKMNLIGTNEFSHSFYMAQPVGNLKPNPNIKISRTSLAWNPRALSVAIQLLSYSIQNVIVMIKVINGVDPSTLQYAFPEDKEAFEKPFEDSSPIPSMTWQINVNIADESLFTRDRLNEIVLKNRKTSAPPT